MTWRPLNLTDACPANSNISACSSFGYVYLNLLVQLYGGSKDERIKAEYGERNEERSNEYDFIVVGAGAAGCVVANRLSENPEWKVLLLEAGPEEPDVTEIPAVYRTLLGSNIDWSYSTEPNGKSCLARAEMKCTWPRGKVMGGSSSINSFEFIRGNMEDYDHWAALGNKGWSFKEVLPFFKEYENNLNIAELDPKYHGVSGEQYISYFPYTDKPTQMLIKAFNETGLPIVDVNGPEQVGTNKVQAFSVNGERVSTNRAFIRPIRYRRKNLVIEINSEATRILIDENKNAYGVIYIKNGKQYTAYAKKEVIVSGGTINSPKLLMLSGIGPKDHLVELGIPVVKDLPVGKNLHDHVSFNGIIAALPKKLWTTESEEQILKEVRKYREMKIKRGPLSSNGPAIFISFIKSSPEIIAPDLEFQIGHEPDWKDLINELTTVDAASILPTAYYNGITPRVLNLVPKSRGKILLNASNPDGPPLIYANYLDDERDFIPLLKGVRFLLSLEKTDAFKSNGVYYFKEALPACKDHEWGTDEYFICLAKSYTSTTYHPVGTCKMGPESDREAVVDNELRVYGVGRLRVIDASIMPIIVRGNTNAPTMMIAERVVHLIIEYWRRHNRKNRTEQNIIIATVSL